MTETSPLRILIQSRREAAARRWAEMLREPGVEVWLGPEDTPPGGRPDVVLADARIETETGTIGRDGPGGAAVVEIGPGGEEGEAELSGAPRPDLVLPDDVTGRELRLVCRLLGRIAALRRRHRREARLRRRLAEEASTDPLTGLPNRRAWDEVLGERLESRLGPAGPSCPALLCVAIVDLDHFKPINDTHGHATGDAVLRTAAGALREGLRPDDFVARLGGDEFALLIEVPDAASAATVVGRVRRRIPAELSAAGQPVVTASAGYQLVPHLDQTRGKTPTPEDLFTAADAALRQAKQQGRDRTIAA